MVIGHTIKSPMANGDSISQIYHIPIPESTEKGLPMNLSHGQDES